VPGHSLGSTRLHLSATATMVAEAPSALVHWRAAMGNLYQYAMRKFSQSGCQSRQGQSLGSAVASWRDGMACGKPSLARGSFRIVGHPGESVRGATQETDGIGAFGCLSQGHDICTTQRLRASWGLLGSPLAGTRQVKAVTWLILPVVICLSQRLSHACLSINCLYGETANGSLNQLEFI
jgi:hypothetical protein